jgi:hypothetical protein
MRFITVFFVAIIWSYSCSNNSNYLTGNSEITGGSNRPEEDSLNNLNLRIASAFAIKYQPDSFAYAKIAKLKDVPDSVVQAFKNLRVVDSASCGRYLTLIYLKLYLDHLRCCHQSYEVRNKFGPNIDSVADPLLLEYVRLTKIYDINKPIEFISSGIGENWVLKNPWLMKDSLISSVMDKMKPVSDSILKHLYW